MRKIYQVITVFFHPLLLSTYFFLIIWIFATDLFSPFSDQQAGRLVLIIFITTFVIPAFSIIAFKYTNSISSLRLHDRKERLLPFTFISIFYALTCYLFAYQLKLNNLVVTYMLSITILVLGCTLITFFKKISIHSAGMGGAVALIFLLYLQFQEIEFIYLSSTAIFLSGAVMSSRLALEAHSPHETWWGFATGLGTVGLSYMALVKL